MNANNNMAENVDPWSDLKPKDHIHAVQIKNKILKWFDIKR